MWSQFNFILQIQFSQIDQRVSIWFSSTSPAVSFIHNIQVDKYFITVSCEFSNTDTMLVETTHSLIVLLYFLI
jgi:hypothetical protein